MKSTYLRSLMPLHLTTWILCARFGDFFRVFPKFLPNLASVADFALLQDASETAFEYTVMSNRSFKALKELLSKCSVLALFDPSLSTKVSIDASDYGLGGVLTEFHPDNVERTFAFASRAPTAAEKNTQQSRRKCWPVCG